MYWIRNFIRFHQQQ
ncbi:MULTISPECIES: hypothetical protein [Aeromonas]